MDVLLFLIAIVAAFALLDMTAIRTGVDSRDGSMDPSSPIGGIFV